MRTSKAKHTSMHKLLQWNSSSDEEISEHVSDAPSSANIPEPKFSSHNQVMVKPLLDTGVMVNQQANRGQGKHATVRYVQPGNASSKINGRPKGLAFQKHNKAQATARPYTSCSPADWKPSPVFPRARKTVSSMSSHEAPLKSPTEISEDSTEEDSDVPSECATAKMKYRGGNTSRPSGPKQLNDAFIFGKLGSSSSSGRSSADADSGATGVEDGNPYLGSTVDSTSKYNTKLMFGSSSSSSSSSDSDSLLSPSKSKRTRVHRVSGAAATGKSADSSTLPNRASSHLQRSQDLRKPVRCKRGLGKNSSRVPSFKRARVSPPLDIVISESSTDTESDEGLLPDVLRHSACKWTGEATWRIGGGKEALGHVEQSPSPQKATRRAMITLFGNISSEEDEDSTEEDTGELGDEQVGKPRESQTSEASASSTRPRTSTSNLTGPCSSDNRPGGVCSGLSRRDKANSLSERDDSIILVDITQSTERGALARESFAQGKANPTTRRGFGESQNADGVSRVFSRWEHSRKQLPDVRRTGHSVIVGNEPRAAASKTTLNDTSQPPRSSHSSGHVPKDCQIVSSSASGLRPLPPTKALSLKHTAAHVRSQSQLGPIHSGSKLLVRKNTHPSSTADNLPVHGSDGESPAINAIHSQGRVSSADSQDRFHLSFEEHHLRWMEDSPGSSHDGNEAPATADPTGSSVTIFNRDFFGRSPGADRPSESCNATKTVTTFALIDGHCPQPSVQSQMVYSVRDDSESPPLIPTVSGVARGHCAAHERRSEMSQLFNSGTSERVSLHEDPRPDRVIGNTKASFSSSSGVNRRSDSNDSVKSKTSGRDAKGKTSRHSKHRSRGDGSCPLTASGGHAPPLQNAKKAEGHISNERAESSAMGFADPPSEVQVLASHSAHHHSTRHHSAKSPLKARHKSKHGATASRNHPARQETYNSNAASLLGSRSTGHPSPDVQIVGCFEFGRSLGEPCARGRFRAAEGSESVDTTDIDVVELVRQLDEDERMAKQLQERFDAELARVTQEHSQNMSSHNEIHPEPITIPPESLNFLGRPLPLPPAPRPPPLFPPSARTAHPSHHCEMTWRDDLVDMNPVNAAMMAEMGRFLEDNTEVHSGRRHRGRQRRGRTRGRGRSRTRIHHNPAESDGNDYDQLWNLVEQVGEAVSKGLPESSVNLLPTFRYAATAAGREAAESECSICMGEYEAGESMRRLPCFHFYHAACIDKWLKDNRICPVCREEVNFEAANFT